MRVLYILHRYHTNQIEIMHGWKEHGDELCMLTWGTNGIEDYTYVKPIVVGYSRLFNIIDDFYVNHLKKNEPFAKDKKLRWGIPPMRKLKKYISDFNPDVVILREKNLYTMMTYSYCKRKGYKTILFNLSPVWAEPEYFKNDWKHRLVNKLVPKYRITPTNQIGNDLSGKVKDENAFWAPFIVKPMCSPAEKKYFADGNINILEIGKYQKRKNHYMMVNVIKRLVRKYPNVRLTITGEISDSFHQDYYEKLKKYIENENLTEYITLKTNISYYEAGEEYKKADIYVLASTGEPASITVIESMAYSVLSLSGTDNGTADYIRDGETGFVYKDSDEDDLFEKLDKLIENQDMIPIMGKAAYEDICNRFQFDSYYKIIDEILNKI